MPQPAVTTSSKTVKSGCEGLVQHGRPERMISTQPQPRPIHAIGAASSIVFGGRAARPLSDLRLRLGRLHVANRALRKKGATHKDRVPIDAFGLPIARQTVS